MAEEQFRIKITGDASELQAASMAGANALRGVEEAARPAAAATEEVGVKGRDLKRVFAELGREFPVLGSLARTMLSPISAAAAAAVVIYQQVKDRLAEIEQHLQVTDWQSYGEETRKALAGGAESGERLRRELEAIRLAAEQAGGASARLMDVFRAQQTAEERLDEARKKVELARAGRLTDPSQRAAAELEIETRYAARSRQRAEERSRFELAEQHRAAANAEINERMLAQRLEAARARNAEAAQIEARLAEERKRLAQTTDDLVKKQERLEEIREMRPGSRFGPMELLERRSLEQQVEQLGAMRAQSEAVIRGLEARKPATVSPEYITLLETMRSGAAARAAGISGMLPTQMTVAGIESVTRREVGGLEDLARLYAAASQAAQQRAQMTEQIMRVVEGGQGVDVATMQRLQAVAQRQAQLEAQVQRMEMRISGLRAR